MEQIKYNLKMSISIHWCASEKIYSAQKTPKTIKMCQNQNKVNLISYYSASSLIRSSLIRFLANPAGFSRKEDLFTLAFNIILVQKKY